MALNRRYILGKSVREKIYDHLKKKGRLVSLVKNNKTTFPIVDKEIWLLNNDNNHTVITYFVYMCREDAEHGVFKRSLEAIEQLAPDCGCYEGTAHSILLSKIYKDLKNLNKPPFSIIKNVFPEVYNDLYTEREYLLFQLDELYDELSEIFLVLCGTDTPNLVKFMDDIMEITEQYNDFVKFITDNENGFVDEDEFFIVKLVDFIVTLHANLENNIITKYEKILFHSLDRNIINREGYLPFILD